MSTALKKMLAYNRRYAPLFGASLANHLSMALVALEEMGADRRRMTQFITLYEGVLRPLPIAEPAQPATDPTKFLGIGERFIELHGYFENEVDGLGKDDAIAKWLPVLMPGLSGSGFHGMIRTAYALLAADGKEVGFSLAYWASAFQFLGEPGQETEAGLGEVAGALIKTGKFPQLTTGIIADRMAIVARNPAFRNAATQPKRLRLSQIAKFCINAFAAYDDFTLLHAVTACHAFRLLRPHLRDEETALRYLWQGVLTALLTTGHETNGRVALSPVVDADWSIPIEAAVASDDAHVIKIVYSAWREFNAYAAYPYFSVARRAVRLG